MVGNVPKRKESKKLVIEGIALFAGIFVGLAGIVHAINRSLLQEKKEIDALYNSALTRCGYTTHEQEFREELSRRFGVVFIEGDYPRYATGEAVHYSGFKLLIEGYCQK